MQIFNKAITKEDRRYQNSWPWRAQNHNLPENDELSLGRLTTQMKRFEKDRDLLQRYNEIIKDQLSKGVIEKVDEKNGNRKYYIPHHAITTPEKSTSKVPTEYDASPKTKKNMKSLNECLHRGPVILENLCGLLLRFRTKRIGIIADIEKAFLQVGLHQVNRDFTRFIWLKDINGKVTDNNIQIYRFARLSLGIMSSPFLLSATVEHFLDETNITAAKQIKDDIYVDNLITGTNNDEVALQLYKEAKKNFHDASVNLRDWISNSKFANENTSPDDLMKERVTKVLGLIWNVTADGFSISTKKLENIEEAKTKLHVLASLASIFDPLSMKTPVTLQMKLFLQELWKKEKERNERLSSEEITT